VNFDDTFILKKETKPIPETWCLDDDDDDDCTFARTFMFQASPPPPPVKLITIMLAYLRF
jgi:hypothetical protein